MHATWWFLCMINHGVQLGWYVDHVDNNQFNPLPSSIFLIKEQNDICHNLIVKLIQVHFLEILPAQIRQVMSEEGRTPKSLTCLHRTWPAVGSNLNCVIWTCPNDKAMFGIIPEPCTASRLRIHGLNKYHCSPFLSFNSTSHQLGKQLWKLCW